MKAFKYSFAAVLLIVAIASCQVADVDSPSGARRHDAPRFAASLESTRVYVDGDLQMYWTADDRISVFTCQGNDQYRFDGQTGDQTCTFTKISEDPMNPRDPLSANYSVYPYRLTTSIAADGVLTMRLPEEQPYASDSFGLGANTMVAVTEGPADYFLKFKNICGFLVVKLYGTGTVKSLVLEGSNGEKLAGKATVTTTANGNPSVTMAETGTTSITLNCGDGVSLGTDEATATAFWFALPPTAFTKGFVVSAMGANGKQAVLHTSISRTVERGVVNYMLPAEAVFNVPEGNVEFDDANFKSYCVKNFDRNKDSEISFAEAALVDTLKASNKSIASMKGIEAFVNLTYLDCSQNRITSLDVSKCTKLLKLLCNSNLISDLNINGNTKLTYLNCSSNALTSLKLFRNPSVTELYCNINQLTQLTLGTCTLLKTLECQYNQLTAINFMGNQVLQTLKCGHNSITALTLLYCTFLSTLDCSNNQIASLTLNQPKALRNLDCSGNQLTSLDISQCTALTTLNCYGNQLSSITFGDNTGLSYLYCSNNNLTSLKLRDSKFRTIRTLYCSNNQLTSLELPTNAVSVDCSYNQLTSLETQFCPPLNQLNCESNLFTSMDFSLNMSLSSADCTLNPNLKTIWLRTGQTISSLRYDDGVTIQYK